MKRVIFYKLVILASLFLMNACYATDVANTNELSTLTQNTSINTTIVGNAHDWNLTGEEWAHYQTLMQGPNGHWYPQLTPPEVLGLNAETEEETQHFAEIVAHEEHDKLARELSFDSAVHQALLRLYPNESVIKAFDLSPFNPIKTSEHEKQKSSVSLQSGDHLVLFVNPNNGIDFATLPQLIADIKSNVGVVLDIFCMGQSDNTVIRNWANLNRIPLNLVAQGRITLNQDKGQLQKIAGYVQLPYVLLVHNGQSKAVSVWSLT